ncbi:hypothetical protein PEPS_33450 (plasmid) [Persicobacter psychrovividus]|uniref:Uncharacterized protein n=1 Tax=Persicobacter psychrovividus TaxID=387638 RepID=A0ABM7VJE7_9BACT|nr:hypothetical protein PEPS_33450 [Persicobacter psychrovividus]
MKIMNKNKTEVVARPKHEGVRAHHFFEKINLQFPIN